MNIRKIKRNMWRKRADKMFRFRDKNSWRRFAKLPELKVDKV